VATIRNFFRIHWKLICWSIVPIAIVAIVFAIPFKTVPIQTTEQYWDTEIKQEPYTATESYTDTESYIDIEIKTETIFNSYIYTGNWEQVVEVDKPGSTVTITLQGYPYYRPLYYLNCPDTDDSFCYPLSSYYYYEFSPVRAKVELSYPEEVTKERTVTKYRDVTKYREVPTQVLKERTTTEYIKVSIWRYLFMDFHA
jgi:hypothetical protein